MPSESKTRTLCRLWQTLYSMQECNRFEGHSDSVNSVSFNPDGQTIASADANGKIKLWRLDGTVVQTFQGHSSGVNSVSFSPDGQILASASDDGTVKLWNLDLEYLLMRGCDWLRNYLKTNPNVSQSDRHLCDDICTQK